MKFLIENGDVTYYLFNKYLFIYSKYSLANILMIGKFFMQLYGRILRKELI